MLIAVFRKLLHSMQVTVRFHVLQKELCVLPHIAARPCLAGIHQRQWSLIKHVL